MPRPSRRLAPAALPLEGRAAPSGLALVDWYDHAPQVVFNHWEFRLLQNPPGYLQVKTPLTSFCFKLLDGSFDHAPVWEQAGLCPANPVPLPRDPSR